MVTRQATVDELCQRRQSFPDVVSEERGGILKERPRARGRWKQVHCTP